MGLGWQFDRKQQELSDKCIQKAATVMGRSLDSVGSVRVQQEGGAKCSALGRSPPTSQLTERQRSCSQWFLSLRCENTSSQQPLRYTIPPVVKWPCFLHRDTLLFVCTTLALLTIFLTIYFIFIFILFMCFMQFVIWWSIWCFPLHSMSSWTKCFSCGYQSYL